MSEKREVNRLTIMQQFALADALRADAEKIRTGNFTIQGLADYYGQLLGFVVSPSSIRTVCEAAKIELPRKKETPASELESLRSQVTDLKRRLDAVELALA